MGQFFRSERPLRGGWCPKRVLRSERWAEEVVEWALILLGRPSGQRPDCHSGPLFFRLLGRPKSLRHSPVADRKVYPKEQASARQLLRPTSPTGALASDTSRLRAVSPIGRPGPKRCFLLRPHDSDRGPVRSLLLPLFSDWRSQGQLGPSDWGRPLGRDQG